MLFKYIYLLTFMARYMQRFHFLVASNAVYGSWFGDRDPHTGRWICGYRSPTCMVKRVLLQLTTMT